MDNAFCSSAPWGDDADAILALRSNLCALVGVGIPSSRRRARVVSADEEKNKPTYTYPESQKERKQKAFDASPHFTAFVGRLMATDAGRREHHRTGWPGQSTPVASHQKAM
jgi:hypothetical protein